jgi:HK97 family phage major capsid protein
MPAPNKSTVETPSALPQLTRICPLEISVRKARTKRVDGADLPARCFVIVGDAERTATWSIPLIVPGNEASTKNLIRNALAEFDTIEILDPKTKSHSWRRISAAAKKYGIAVPIEGKSAELLAWRAAAEAEEPDPDDPDEDEEDEDERDSDVFEMSFSSEAPVERWFGDEILDHSAECVDLTRAANGLAYLIDHNTREQVGIIENLRVDKKKLRGDVRFSRSQRGQDIKRDVLDGIRPFTSVGYRVMEMVLEKETKDDAGTKRTYRVTKWQPMEGSSVAVPADHSVGAGRSAAGEKEFPVQVRSAVQSESAQAQPALSTHVEVRTMNPKDAAEILRLCNTHGIDSKRAAEIIEKEGQTVDSARSEILADIGKRGGKPVVTPAAERSGQMLELTENEQKKYNLCRGIMTHVRNTEENKRESSFETEVSDEIEKRWEGKKHGGLYVPFRLSVDPQLARDAVARYGAELLARSGVSTALTAATATKGHELVFTEPGPFIQFLYNRMRLKELGAETISGLQGNIAFPKQTGKAGGSWVGENPGTDVADSNLTLAQVSMSPKTYQSSTAYSRQLLAQSVIDIDNLVRQDLARDCALSIDSAGINGTGSSNDPIGILHTSGVQSYTLEGDTAGNGAKPVWDDVTFMEELLEDVNADQLGDPGWLTTPGLKGLFKRTPRLLYAPAGGTTVNVTGDPIWTDENEIDGLMARQSNQVPKNLVTGTSGANCHALILGVFSALVNGLWGSGFELVVDPYRLKKQGLIELTTFILTDWANRYPVAFAAATDCLRS